MKLLSIVYGIALGGIALAQGPTLRQRVELANDSVVVIIKSDSQPVTLNDILDQTDVIARGVVGASTSKLTPDESDVFTTFELAGPKVAFQANPPQLIRPGVVPRPVSVTVKGGTVTIGSHTVTVNYPDLPTLKPGMEIIALLSDRDSKYVPAAGQGLVAVRNGRVELLSHARPALQNFGGAVADEVLNQIATIRNGRPHR